MRHLALARIAPRLPSITRAIACGVLALGVVAARADRAAPTVGPIAEPAGAGRPAALVRVRLPLAGNDDRVLQSRLQRAVEGLFEGLAERDTAAGGRPLLVLEFTATDDGGATEFERALALARFLAGPEMAAVQTVAYLPRAIDGHAVLLAIACEEIAMAADATLGPATPENAAAVEPAVLAAYRQIADARRTVPVEVVTALVDPEAELVRIESDAGVEYAASAETLAKLREERSVVAEAVLAPAGSAAEFTGREARREGFAQHLATDRAALAQALDADARSLSEDESGVGEWRPVMIDVTGPVTPKLARRVETLIGDELERNGVNWIGVRIESSSGDLAAALRLAQSLAELNDGVRTVAYVPSRAEGPAALVALACDQLVMQSGATLLGSRDEEPAIDDDRVIEVPADGDEAPEAGADAADDPAEAARRLLDRVRGKDAMDARDAAVATVRDTLAPAAGRSWSLLAATIDATQELARYQNRQSGATRLMNETELAEAEDSADWRRQEVMKAAGEPLELSSKDALAAGVAWQTIEAFDDLRALYGFDAAPRTAEPNWALELVEALASPGLATLLLLIGIVGLYVELNTPGLGLGGFLATLAFVLFFWSKFLDGTADWLEVTLFITGVVFVLIELIVLPGFGVFGLGGGLLIVAGLVLASQTFVLPKTETQLVELRNSLASVVGAGVGFLAVGLVLRQYLPHSPLFRRATLAPPEEADRIEQSRREQLADYAHLVGKTGVATTDLLPSGLAEIDGEPVQVQTDGGVIERGDAVEVVSARASRVVVRRVRG
ncbi:MAG: NfeD family protein [Planctomycetota bacterium]